MALRPAAASTDGGLRTARPRPWQRGGRWRGEESLRRGRESVCEGKRGGTRRGLAEGGAAAGPAVGSFGVTVKKESSVLPVFLRRGRVGRQELALF